MDENRRKILQFLGAGLVIAAAPPIASFNPLASLTSGLLNFTGGQTSFGTGPVDRTLDEFLKAHYSNNPFAAYAEVPTTKANPLRVIGTEAALFGIFDKLDLPKTFSSQPDFSNGAQCKGNFEQRVDEWQRQDYSSFTDLVRSPLEQDVAYMIGGNIDSGHHLYEAQGSTQYQSYDEIPLSENDPGVTLAAAALFDGSYNLDDNARAQSLALTNKELISLGDVCKAWRYETPISSFVHDSRPRYDSKTNQHFNKGMLVARMKQAAEPMIYFAGLYG